MFGERLAFLRKAKGMKQVELANELDLAQDAISKYERGISIPIDETKVRIAQYFNVSLDYLMGAIDIPAPMLRDGFTLSKDFPTCALPELKKYADYLEYEHNTTDEEKRLLSHWSRLGQSKKDALLKLMSDDDI